MSDNNPFQWRNHPKNPGNQPGINWPSKKKNHWSNKGNGTNNVQKRGGKH